MAKGSAGPSRRRIYGCAAALMLGVWAGASPADAAVERAAEELVTIAGCNNVTEAHVVALDQPFFWNRFGAVEPQGMMYALKRDVVPTSDADGLPDPGVTYTLNPGQVVLRRDKRPRPLVLRVNAGDCLRIYFTNLLSPTVPNSRDEQPRTRAASIHVSGLEAVTSIKDMGANVGANGSGGNGVVATGGTATYTLYAPAEGQYIFYSMGAVAGGEGDGGSISAGLFGAVIVEPAGSEWYRSQVTKLEFDAAKVTSPDSYPRLDYAAVFPAGHRYAGKPVLRMTQNNEIVHSDLTAIVTGPNAGNFGSGYLPSTNTYPNRSQPFREFTVIFHDEIGAVQAFPQFETDNLHFTLHSVRDAFAINYGTGGVGAEILANRLGVGPALDCPECKYEEFFLSSWSLGDPSMVVDTPANAPCTPAQIAAGTTTCLAAGRKATKALYPDDPSNVYHSYMSDHVKFRNLHAGSDDHHIFHLHAHQWLHNPASDLASYRDSQAIGQGGGFTYEITYGGSGNRNKTVGDSIFHCHFYPHFAQGMWSLWRVHDVLETGTELNANGKPVNGARALPDNEIFAGTPIPGLVPLPTLPMAPLPGPVSLTTTGQVKLPTPVTANPGYPFFIPGRAGRRPPKPPLDIAQLAGVPLDGGLPRHVVLSGTATSTLNRFNLNKVIDSAEVKWLSENGQPEEIVAMNFHANAAGYVTPKPKAGAGTGTFKVNGHPGVAGAPYADPCWDDAGNKITDIRYYKAADIQIDAKLNKSGWHFPQTRMIALWSDVQSYIANTKPPEPFFFRASSGQCIEYWLTNLVPNKYVVDDFQVTTPTDVLGQHIHLVKFDVTASDGAGNGWNYEDGSFGGEEVQERIHAIRVFNGCDVVGAPGSLTSDRTRCPVAKVHPYFTGTRDANCDGVNDFLGAQTTVQRWWADPITNLDNSKRTLRTVFTHDHFGPSTHQQTGLYAGLVIEPAGTNWYHNETGVQLSTNSGTGINQDGGPTSWQALVTGTARANNYREFLLEFADFQPAYTPGGPICPNSNLSVGWIDPARAVNPPGREEAGLPFLWAKPDQCPVPEGSSAFLAPPCPEAVSADDIGMMAVNYRNEPIGLRVRKPGTNTQASGKKGDLSFAYQSRIDRAEAALNSQPLFYPPLTTGLFRGDPFTPLLRAYEGDPVKVRALVGAHEETHNFNIHGVKWLGEPDDPNTGYRNSQLAGISEWFDFEIPRIPSLRDGYFADFLYKPSAASESQWVGAWGILRVYRTGNREAGANREGETTQDKYPADSGFQLQTVPQANETGRSEAPDTTFLEVSTTEAADDHVNGADVDPGSIVPIDSEGRVETGVAEADPEVVPSTPTTAIQPRSTIRVGCPATAGTPVPFEIAAVSAKEALQDDPGTLDGLIYNARTTTVTGPTGSHNGPLWDPTAILFVYKSDLSFVGGRPRLSQTVRREPLVMRAVAGKCLKVKLWNYLPKAYTDLDGFNSVNMIVEDFNANQVKPSREISLHPQLVYYDLWRADGSNVGLNPSQFGKQTVTPGDFRTFYWYAGDVRGATATPVEFGVTGLTSADPIKHSNKGLVGALVVEPPTATWTVAQDSNLKTTRASAYVTSSNTSFKDFREFVFVYQDDINLRYSNGDAVPPLIVNDDAEDSGQKAFNYRTDPLWFRAGWAPDQPTEQTRLFTQFDQLLSNNWSGVGGDPQTPVFVAKASEGLRFHVVAPAGHTQAHAFEVHGHPIGVMPFFNNSTRVGLSSTTPLFGVMSIGATGHSTAVVKDGAGGKFLIPGDYLYRDYPAPRFDDGLWGLLRVE